MGFFGALTPPLRALRPSPPLAGSVDGFAFRVDGDRHRHVFDFELLDRFHAEGAERYDA